MRLSFHLASELDQQLYMDLDKISPGLSQQQWQNFIDQQQLYYCVFNQRHVAYCLLEKQQDSLSVSQFRVRDITQRRGIGLFMFQQLMDTAKTKHCDSLEFPICTELSGIAFYRQMGIEAQQQFKI